MQARRLSLPLGLVAATWLVLPAAAAPYSFSTGNPDGRIATLSRPASAGQTETETADDFILGQTNRITHATFEIELYQIFRRDPATPPSGNLPAWVNSPADNQFEARDSALGNRSLSTTLLNAGFSAANSIVNGVNKVPNQWMGGEGSATGQEV